jgi:hypothetical protein
MTTTSHSRKRTIAVFFNVRREGLPMRRSNETHLLAWGRYSLHHIIYVNVAYRVPWGLLRRAGVDVLIFDTTFCSMHWVPAYFRERSQLCRPVGELDCPKIAVVQDEFTNIDIVQEFLESVSITHVFTCSKPQDWARFYPRLGHVTFRTVLTAYVDPLLAERSGPPPSQRPVAIAYRGGRNPFWLGSHGMLKSGIADAIRAAAEKRGLTADIAQPGSAQYLKGEAWFDFLRSSRCVLGVEGGSSINDHDGSLRTSVEAYLADHPQAGFEEVQKACFPGRDGEVDLACISPRHLEAAATRTAQLLVEGHYSGVLEPWRHYIPLKADGSNIEDALTAVMDDAAVDAMAERAFADVVGSGRWSYPAFVRETETSVIEAAPLRPGRRGLGSNLARWLLVARAALLWRFAHLEASAGFTGSIGLLAGAARRLESIGPLRKVIVALRSRARRMLGIAPRGAEPHDRP